MSIIPWLNYPGRPIKRKPYKMPYSPPYKGSPYEYINLPTPDTIPSLFWENIMKDFDQSFRISYKELTSAKIVADETEFEQQPGAVGIAINADPREYIKKGFGKVAANTFKSWLQSVISWSDLDVITEQQYIWKPLTRGQNGGRLGQLLTPVSPGSDLYEGADRNRIHSFATVYPQGMGKWFDEDKTPYENLSTLIENWARYGRSRVDRMGQWGMLQRAWLDAVAIDVTIFAIQNGIHLPSYPDIEKFINDAQDVWKTNGWIFRGSKLQRLKGVTPLVESPFRTAAGGGRLVLDTYLTSQGFDPKLDNPIFKYQLCADISKKTGISAQKLYAMSDADIASVISGNAAALKKIFGKSTPAALSGATAASARGLMSTAEFEKAKSFYESKMTLINGQLFTLETQFIGNPFVPPKVRAAAIKKHKELNRWIQQQNKKVDELTADLHRRAQDLRGDLERLGANPALFDWQKVLQFREHVYLTQDFLEAAFDENTLFRTYVWIGKMSAHLPDWMGNWKARLTYLTPSFYTSQLIGWLDDNVLGLASFGDKGLFLRRFANAAYFPLAGGKEVLFKASDFFLLDPKQLKGKDPRDFWDAYKKLGKLVDNKAVINGTALTPEVKNVLLTDVRTYPGVLDLDSLVSTASPVMSTEATSAISDALDTIKKNLLTQEELEQFRAFRDYIRAKYGSLINVDNPEEFARFLDTAKGKFIKKEFQFAGPLIRLGRFLDHTQNVIVNRFIKPIPVFGKYADWFKSGNLKFAKMWDASKIGKSLNSLSAKLINIGGGGGTGTLAKILGSKALGSLTKVVGSLLGAVGGIVSGIVVWIGGKLISDLFNLLRGKPVEATKEAVAKLGKFILGAAACCLSPLILLIFIIMFFIPAVFGLIHQAGQAVTIGAIFDRLDVTKNGSYNPSTNSIKYIVTVTNKDSKPQKIQFVRDSASVYLEDCSLAPIILTTTAGGSYGYLDFSGMSPGLSEHIDLQSGQTVVYEYEIKDVPSVTGNITYLNKALIEIVPRTGVGVSDTGTVRKQIDFGGGGCKETGNLAAIASALKDCLALNHSAGTYLILNPSCVANKPVLNTINCSNAFAAYYSSAIPLYYPSNLQCVAFANIAVGCYGGADYYVNGNGSDWFDTADGTLYSKYRAGSAPFAPPEGALLIFSASSGGHVGIVTQSSTSGNRTTVKITGSNMRRTEYTLLFDAQGTFINPEALPGLTFVGFLVAN